MITTTRPSAPPSESLHWVRCEAIRGRLELVRKINKSDHVSGRATVDRLLGDALRQLAELEAGR